MDNSNNLPNWKFGTDLLDSAVAMETDSISPPLPATDEQLLRSFIEDGNRGAFETLLRRYQHEIYNYLRRTLGDDHLAEDAFQLTFVKVYQRAEQFDLERRFRPWLYGVATHQAIDLKRKFKRQSISSLDSSTMNDSFGRAVTPAERIPDHRAEQIDPLLQTELKEQMVSAFDELNEMSRDALELVYLRGLPYKDAAEALKIPIGTVKSRVHTAIRKLAEVWKRREGIVGDESANSLLS